MSFPVHYLTVSVLIFVGFQFECSFTTEPSVVSELSLEQLMVFTDQNNGSNPFFSYLNFDPKNSSRIYIGAVDFLYVLNAHNISALSTKSDNLTSVNDYRNFSTSSLKNCQRVQKYAQSDYRCRNHIRALFPIQNEIYVCGTGANSPQEFYVDYHSLKYVALGPVGSSAVTKCPDNPAAQYTVLYVGQWRGTPDNVSAIFSSINSDNENTIYRSPLQRHRTSVNPLGLQMPLSAATVVASYEIDQYVYYFFREIANEASGMGTVRYSRVARVCKNDNGSSLESKKFLTFVKATLNCSVGTGDDILVYYNNLYDIWYDASDQVFYGLFMASQNDSWGSAICKYSYATIAEKFDKGQFFSRETPEALWTVTPDDMVPNPRPSLCLASNTMKLENRHQAFALTHPLMNGAINQITTTPLYYNHDVGYRRLTVEFIQGFEGSFTIFCLYSDKRPDEIVRVVQWIRDGVTSSRIFSILRPFDENKSMLREMILQKSAGKSWLYVVKDTAVYQISMDVCSQYKLCTECVIDPYCGWNSTSNQCMSFKTGLLQNVTGSSALTACGAVCKVSSLSYRFCIPGMAVHLNCSSRCSPEGSVTWKFPNGSVVQTVDPNFFITPNGGLLILNLTSDLNGVFTCMSNGVVLAEHTIKASSCQYSDDIQAIVAREFHSWCNTFEQYKTEYTEWICSKKNACIDHKYCINSKTCRNS